MYNFVPNYHNIIGVDHTIMVDISSRYVYALFEGIPDYRNITGVDSTVAVDVSISMMGTAPAGRFAGSDPGIVVGLGDG